MELINRIFGWSVKFTSSDVANSGVYTTELFLLLNKRLE